MQPVAPVRAGVRPVADAPRASLDVPDSLSGWLERYFELSRLLKTPVPRRTAAACTLQREQRDEMRAALAARTAVQAEIAAVFAAIDAPGSHGAVRDLMNKLARECDRQQRNSADAARPEAMVQEGHERIPPLEATLSVHQREVRAWEGLIQCFADVMPQLGRLEAETRAVGKLELRGPSR